MCVKNPFQPEHNVGYFTNSPLEILLEANRNTNLDWTLFNLLSEVTSQVLIIEILTSLNREMSVYLIWKENISISFVIPLTGITVNMITITTIIIIVVVLN